MDIEGGTEYKFLRWVVSYTLLPRAVVIIQKCLMVNNATDQYNNQEYNDHYMPL